MGLRRGLHTFHGGVGMIEGCSGDEYNWNMREAWDAIHASYASGSVAAALGKRFWDGRVLVGRRPFRWNAASLINDPGFQVAIKPTVLGDSDPGRFELDQQHTILRTAVTYATADAAALWTVPTGVVVVLQQPFAWLEQITVNWTGGSSSAVGLSTNKSGYNVKGDLLGGSAGLLTADLTTTIAQTLGKRGTLAHAGGSRLVDEYGLAVATAAATPRFAIKSLLYAKTTGTGAAGAKSPLANGATPAAGQAAPNSAGTSIALHAESTGTGTMDVSYLSDVANSFETVFLVAGDAIRWDRITSAFTAGAAVAAVAARIIKL